MCDNYFISYHKNDILCILQHKDENKHFSININFLELFENDPNLGNSLLSDPEETIEEWNQSLSKVQTSLIMQERHEEGLIFKPYVHCRIHGLPACPELHRGLFPKNEDVGKFLQVSGTVVRMTATKLLESERQYICTKCKYQMTVKADYEKKNVIVPPKHCLNPEECKGTHIINVGNLDSGNCGDYQEIKIQEQVSKLSVGSMPNSMWVTLEDDLVEICKPGDNITICGIVKRRWTNMSVGKKVEIELALKANHIQVTNSTASGNLVTSEIKQMFKAYWENYKDRPLVGRDFILKSFCPQLFGLYTVKLAVSVVLAGGTHLNRDTSTGVNVRSEPHLLLVGDPGTGKSHLLRFASKVVPRSVLTTGVGSTAAGLTVTAVMENGEWQLEGGALVLSDGGICCIDEFNSMKEHDRTCIHEAMEQQTISVAKASIVCKLNTRCSILAATNPKGNLDPSQPLSMNVALASPLLSRFDLILLLKDDVNDDWDSQVADYILDGKYSYSKLTDNVLWNLEMLQAYFATIKKINPVLSPEAHKILMSYYQMQRKDSYRNKARTTVRLLDSLVRLSQGHARLMYHEEVAVIDVLYAILLVEAALEQGASAFDLRFDGHGKFPGNPMETYRKIAQTILSKLSLPDILEKELGAYTFSSDDVSIDNDEVFGNKIESRFFAKRKVSSEVLNQVPENSLSTSLFNRDRNKGTDLTRSGANAPEVIERILVEENSRVNTGNSEVGVLNVRVTEKETADSRSVGKILEPGTSGVGMKVSRIDQKQKVVNARLNSNEDSRKRKNLQNRIAPKKQKKSKFFSENDVNILNHIPSVNDDFELLGLDFEDEDNHFSELNGKNIVQNDKYRPLAESTVLLDQNEEIDHSLAPNQVVQNEDTNKMNQIACNRLDIRSASANNPPEKHIANIPSLHSRKFPSTLLHSASHSDNDVTNSKGDDSNTFSQNTRLRVFKNKFSFKPKKRILSKTNSEDSGFSSVNFNRTDSEQSRTSNASSVAIFQSQQDELDDLDLEI